MAMKPVKFRDVSREHFQAIRAWINAQAEKMTNNGDSGCASGYGFEVA